MEPDRVNVELAKDILRYYLRNPEAVDTLEGIARWRLLEQRVHQTVIEVQQALDWLISEGLLVQKSRPGSFRLIGLNPDRWDDALGFVDQREANPRE